MSFPHYHQTEGKDCGPTCLKIIAKHYGKTINTQTLRNYAETTREGSNLLALSDAAEKIGFRTLGAKLSATEMEEIPLPCILHWNKVHYVVLYKIYRRHYYISDPAFGLIVYSQSDFIQSWIGSNANENTQEGIALLLEPTPKFKENDFDKSDNSAFGFELLSKYLWRYRSFIIQLCFGLLAGSLLQLIAPFLTQSVVDIGIQNQNLQFVYLILFAQLFLFLGSTTLEFIRSWILLHLSTRINISLISDFFIKLMNLPISFFDVRLTGDIMQRINDHHRIEKILTTSSLSVLFSLINMFIMGGVLAYYNLQIFLVFITGSFFYFFWIILFLRRREALDYTRFSQISQEQSKVIELISGMQEIKLHNAEKQKRWDWEYIQARLFKISIKSLTLEQVQHIGSSTINQLKNIFIAFLTAKLVIAGQITLGMMLSITAIVGGLDGPVMQLVYFIRELQDAKISLRRLAEIHEKEDEIQNNEEKTHDIDTNADITIKDLSFRYAGMDTNVLENLNLTIPAHKITAIVGSSGSGKTTLMKLLLNFYQPNNGDILIGTTPLSEIAQKTWRNVIGCVMQEGFIFNDTIASNIAIGVDHIKKEKLHYAAEVANIKDFVDDYPLKYNTKIGTEGVGMSTGQKQRLLIARAVYKNPEILFLDEATSALDANNEKEIMEKLNIFLNNKTVVVIAHRLSTVINAHQIVVLEKGKIIEQGTHTELIANKGNYYQLIKNQLQLGS